MRPPYIPLLRSERILLKQYAANPGTTPEKMAEVLSKEITDQSPEKVTAFVLDASQRLLEKGLLEHHGLRVTALAYDAVLHPPTS